MSARLTVLGGSSAGVGTGQGCSGYLVEVNGTLSGDSELVIADPTFDFLDPDPSFCGNGGTGPEAV